MAGGRPILFGIGGLALLSILAAVVISFSIVSIIANPPAPHMTIAEAADGLISDTGARGLGLHRSLRQSTPLDPATGPEVLPAIALAESLRVPVSDVRVRVRGGRRAVASTFLVRTSGGLVTKIGVTDVRQTALLNDRRTRLALLIAARRIPVVAAAVRQRDGRWAMVEAATGATSVWRLRLLTALGLSALLLAPFAWLAARRLTQPIRALADHARGMDLTRTDEERGVDGPREVREAAAAITEMRSRLEAQSAERSRMLAAVAHDLRTPLTGLRIRAEAASEEERDKMVAEIARMEAMIAQILSYTSGEAAHEPLESVDLAQLLAQLADRAQEQGRAVIFRPHPELRVLAAPLALHRAIDNLVENAVRYGGNVELSLRCEGAFAVVSVEDDGPGLPADLLTRVQEPFFRAESSRNTETGGVGLGLAIARDVIEAHNGSLILNNRPGGGLSADVRLPRPLG